MGFVPHPAVFPPLLSSSNFPGVIKAVVLTLYKYTSAFQTLTFKNIFNGKSTLSNLLQLFLPCHQGDTERRTSLALQEGGKAGGELKWEMEKKRQRED